MQLLYAQPFALHRPYALWGKRALDLALTCLCAPLWGPLLCALWLLSFMEAGQGFYSEQRVGRGGRIFTCLKIRTMRRGTKRGCAAHKARSDPRVTPLGRVLRRTSLDELPQLICVLRGEMSLVGPRPVPLDELGRYGALQSNYLALRPGLTGLWQVSGRNALPYAARVALDVQYSQRISLMGDLRILLATCAEVCRLSGR